MQILQPCPRAKMSKEHVNNGGNDLHRGLRCGKRRKRALCATHRDRKMVCRIGSRPFESLWTAIHSGRHADIGGWVGATPLTSSNAERLWSSASPSLVECMQRCKSSSSRLSDSVTSWNRVLSKMRLI